MILNTHYPFIGGGVPGEKATIVVSAPTGSTVTATLGTTVLRATEKNGVWTFNVRAFGVWTIKATLGSESAQTTVNVTQDTTYNVVLSYVNPADGILFNADGETFVPATGLVYVSTLKRWTIGSGATATLSDVSFSNNTTTLTFTAATNTGFDVSIDETSIGRVNSSALTVAIPSRFIGGSHTISIKNRNKSQSQLVGTVLSFNV